VHPIIFTIFKIGTVLALLTVARYGWIAATESDGPRKARARLIASLLFSSSLCIAPMLKFFYDESLPIFEVNGKIDSVNVRNSSSKYYSAYMQIQTNSGGDVVVHASDRNERFHIGQQVKVRYRGETGELVKAYFYSNDGSQEGVFNNTLILSEVSLFLVGIFCVWASIRKYRRDPEGSES
jgi:hypothetical protein